MSQRNHLRDSIKVIVETLWEAERYDEAIVCSKKMCDAYADLNKGVNMGYADALTYLGLLQKAVGDYAEAAKTFEQSWTICEKISKQPTDYSVLISRSLEECFRKTGYYAKAAGYGEKLLEVHRIMNRDMTKEVTNDYYHVAMDYFNSRDYVRSRDYFVLYIGEISRLDIDEDDEDDEYYFMRVLTAYTLIGRCSYELENYTDAQSAFEFVDSICCEYEEYESRSVMIKNFLGLIAMQTDMGKALQLFSDAEDLYFKHKDEFKDEDLIYKIRANMAFIYMMESPEESYGFYCYIIEYFEEKGDVTNELYSTALLNKATCLVLMGIPDDALSLVDKAIDILKARNFEGMQIYLDALSTKAMLIGMLNPNQSLENNPLYFFFLAIFYPLLSHDGAPSLHQRE